MSRVRELENKFKNNEISKEEYIVQMHTLHEALWGYTEFIQDKNVRSINITVDGIVFETANGIKLLSDPLDQRITPVEILNFGDYELDDLAMINQLLAPDSCIVDIGANVGWHSLNWALGSPKRKITAFEPVPKSFEYLNKNIQLNGVQNIETHNFGFSDQKGEVEFFYDDKLSCAASMRDLYEDRKKQKVKCQVKRLDDCASMFKRIDFIKCDVEGGELLVLQGGLDVIGSYKPILFVEMLRKWSGKFGYHPNDIISALSKLGYECHAIAGKALTKVSEVTEQTIQTNFYFLDPQKHRNQLNAKG